MVENGGPLSLSVSQGNGGARVTVAGEVDIHTCGQLEEALLRLAEEGTSTVTLDLAEVGFIDSSGLRALVVGHKALEGKGGSLVVTNPSAMAARLLEVTGLNSLFGGSPGS